MKKNILLLLSLSLVLSLMGCAADKSPESTLSKPEPSVTETQPTETTTLINSDIDQLPMYTICLSPVTEEETAEDGTVVFRNCYQNISLIIPDPEVADKIILDFLNRTDSTDTQAAKSSALQAYKDFSGPWHAYLSQTIYTPVRIDQSVLSLSGNHSSYTGGAHSQNVTKSVTYDILTGNVLTAADIFTQDASSDAVTKLVLEQLKEAKVPLFEGYETTVTEKFGNSLEHNTDWYFSDHGLCYYFSPYEIGPFSSDTVVAQIPYNKLTGILRDEYFPAEQDTVTGAIEVLSFDKAKLEDFSQFAEITTGGNTEKYILFTKGGISDVIITQNVPSYENPYHMTQYVIFAARTLTPGDAVVLNTEDLSTLFLTYTSGGERITKPLS